MSQSMARRTPVLQSLWIAAALLAVLQPQWIMRAGFMLSFSATAAILILTPGLARTFAGFGIPGRTLAVSLAAYIGVSPGAAFVFSELTPVSVVSTPLVLPALVLAGFASIVTVLIPATGPWTIYGIDALSITVSACAESLPPPISVSAVSATMLMAFLLLLRCLALTSVQFISRTTGILFVLMFLRLHAGPVPSITTEDEIHVLDVGQGQSVLLRSGLRTLLIDGGGSFRNGSDMGIREVIPALLDQGVRRLDVFALSHGDDDHSGGAISVLERLDVGELWLPPGSTRDPRLRRIQDFAEARGIAVRQMRMGHTGMLGRMRWQIVHPAREDLWRSDNEKSLVLHLSTHQGSVLIPGDLEGGGERSLLRRRPGLESTILILGHHGASRASGDLLLDTVKPVLAIASCGVRNRFHHPSELVRGRLHARAIPLRRTDREGTIVVNFYGEQIR
jgi:competence protein ComEC